MEVGTNNQSSENWRCQSSQIRIPSSFYTSVSRLFSKACIIFHHSVYPTSTSGGVCHSGLPGVAKKHSIVIFFWLTEMRTEWIVLFNCFSKALILIRSLCLTHSLCFLSLSGLDRSQRQGVEDLISAVPCRFDHAALFPMLQKRTLQHRMNDSFSCLVRESERLSIIECLFICQTFLGKNIVVQASAKKGDRLPILEGEWRSGREASQRLYLLDSVCSKRLMPWGFGSSHTQRGGINGANQYFPNRNMTPTDNCWAYSVERKPKAMHGTEKGCGGVYWPYVR